MDQQAPTRVPTPPEGETYLGSAFAAKTDSKFREHDYLIYAILAIVAMSLVTIIIGVATLTLDQLHFNNQIYRDGYNPPVQTKDVTQTVPKPVILKPTTAP